jgi:hypothetical protein
MFTLDFIVGFGIGVLSGAIAMALIIHNNLMLSALVAKHVSAAVATATADAAKVAADAKATVTKVA